MGFSGYYALTESTYRLWNYHPEPVEPLEFVTRAGRRIAINERFETDGATVPRFLWWIPGLDPMDWPKAAILHDWLWELRYRGSPAIGFFGSNRLLREAIRSLGWSALLAWSVWLAVTLFGWWFWWRGGP